jgi:hypothetical protein
VEHTPVTAFIQNIHLEDASAGAFFGLNFPEPGRSPTESRVEHPIFTLFTSFSKKSG